MARRDRTALAQLTDALEEQGRGQDAEALLMKARAASPRSAMVATLVADFLQRHGRSAEGAALLRETLASDPQSLVLMSSLAYALAEVPGHAREALDLIDKVLKKQPDQPAYLDTKGWALFHLKRLGEAEAVLRAAAAASESGVVRAHLADVLRERGQTEEAVTHYERALRAPDLKDHQRAEIQEKLDGLRAAPSPAGPPRP